jgi:hypothetical protein
VPFFRPLDELGMMLVCCKLKFWHFSRTVDGVELLDASSEVSAGGGGGGGGGAGGGGGVTEPSVGDDRGSGVIMAEGQLGNEMYVIEAGSVSVTQRGRHLGTLHTGDFFGENAVLLLKPTAPPFGHRRVRTVVCAADSRTPGEEAGGFVDLWCLLSDELRALERLYPPLRRVVRPFRRQVGDRCDINEDMIPVD